MPSTVSSVWRLTRTAAPRCACKPPVVQRLHPDGGWLQPLCTEAERLRPLQPGLPPYALQVRLNRGLLGVAQGQCEAAAIDCDAVVQIEPTNAVAANNFAVCQLYCCELTKAITYLEGFVKADPRNRTHHALCAAKDGGCA